MNMTCPNCTMTAICDNEIIKGKCKYCGAGIIFDTRKDRYDRPTIPCSCGVMIETFNQGCEVYVRASITLTGKKYQEGAKAFLVHKATGIALKRLSQKILKGAK